MPNIPRLRRMAERNELELSFQTIPEESVRKEIKGTGFKWNSAKKCWYAQETPERLALAERLCGRRTACTEAASVHRADYALRLKIKDIVRAHQEQLADWENTLQDYVNQLMAEDNVAHAGHAVSRSQTNVWRNCFDFIAQTLSDLSADMQEFEFIFEYSLPGTVHERPDVLLLTDDKVISLEFKKKQAPQMDCNQDDVAQAIRYRQWLENHHRVTKERGIEVKSYLVCTHSKAVAGTFRGIEVLTRDNFLSVIAQELTGASPCSFCAQWLTSSKTEMPDMLQAIALMYREGRIPYLSDVNQACLSTVLTHIETAKREHKKILILIHGVPGAGKTAVGQSIVYEENRNGHANAVYLSGNGPLVEVLQYQIDQVGNHEHMGENAIQGMKEFKASYFYRNNSVPEQPILIFDEAQRAWDAAKLGRGFSEPEGLFRVGDRIFAHRGYAVLIGLYGDGQVIHTGEEAGLSLWEAALTAHEDWHVVVSEGLADQLQGLGPRKILDRNVFLPASLRADFIDCSRWVEQAINRTVATAELAKQELQELQKTSLRICVTRELSKIHARKAELDVYHPAWKYGFLISNFAEKGVVIKALPGWDIGYNGRNAVSSGGYGPWFAGESKGLHTACSVYGCQGLELDCPIIVFGGDYIRRGGRWIARGSRYDYNVRNQNYEDPDGIVENNYRVLLTRARKEMILLIPPDHLLDETYQYFLDMGMEPLVVDTAT